MRSIADINSLEQFIEQYPLVFIALLAWTLWWKGRALWRAAERGERVWFVVILLVNLLGLLEIFYLYGPGRKPKGETAPAA